MFSWFLSSGSMNQFTAIYNGNGELINNIKYYDGFMGQRVGAISCLAFHPHWVCMLSCWVLEFAFLSVRAGRGEGPETPPAQSDAAAAWASDRAVRLAGSPAPVRVLWAVPAAAPAVPLVLLGCVARLRRGQGSRRLGPFACGSAWYAAPLASRHSRAAAWLSSVAGATGIARGGFAWS